MRLFLFLIFATLLFADEYNDPYLASDFDGDPSCYVENVNIITGDLILGDPLLTVRGAEPIVLPHIYIGREAGGNYYGWHYFDYLRLRFVRDYHLEAYTTNQGETIYLRYYHPSGTVYTTLLGGRTCLFKTKNWDGENNGSKFDLDKECLKSGVTNTHDGEPGGRTNLHNLKLIFSDGLFILENPDGTKRFYKKLAIDLDEVHQFVLIKETKPNGNKVFYSYCPMSKKDKDPQLSEIKTTDPSEQIVFAWTRFSYSYNTISISTSDGQNATLHYGEKGYIQALLDYRETTRRPKEQFAYTKNKLLKTRDLPEGRRFYYESYTKGQMHTLITGKKIKGDKFQAKRICTLKRTFDSSEWTPYLSFEYQAQDAESKGGSTITVDQRGTLTTYHYNKHFRPTRIESEINIEEFSWGKKDSDQASFLMGKCIYDKQKNLISSINNTYDTQGNVTKKVFFDGAQSHTTHTTYNEKNLPIRIQEQNGKVTTLTYFGNTDLVEEKQIYDQEKLLITEHYTYQFGQLTKKVVTTDSHTFTTKITLRECEPFIALPEMIEHYGGDELISKQVLVYDDHANIICKEIYDAHDNLAYTLHYTYDEKGRLISETNPLGQTATTTYDPNFNPTSFTPFANNHTLHHQYNLANQRTQTTHDGDYLLTTTFTYDSFGNKTSETDPFGQKTTFINNTMGLPTEIRAPPLDNRDHITKTTYSPHALPQTITNAEGHTKTIHYNGRKKPLHIIHEDGAEETFTYDPTGNLLSHTDQEGNITTYTYDIFGNKTSRATPLTTERFTYDPLGHLLTHTDPRGFVTHYTYNTKGQKIAEEKNGEKISYTYDPLGNLASTTIEGDHPLITKYTYDLLGHLLTETQEDAFGITLSSIAYTYDSAGNKITTTKQIQNVPATSTTTYDTLNRPTSQTDPLGNTTTISYHYSDILTTITTNPRGVQTKEIYNPHGKLALLQKFSPTDELLLQEELTYNLTGAITSQKSLVLPANTTRRIDYIHDPLNRITKRIEAAHTHNPKITRYTYTPKGQEKTHTKPDGTTITTSYDALGRKTSLTAPGIDYTYAYDPLNNLTFATDHISQTTIERHYDHKSNLVLEKTPHYTISHTYNNCGQKTSTILPSGTITYTYNPLHLTAVTYKNQTHTYTYDTSGNLIEETLPYSLGTIKRTFDLNQNITSLIAPGFEQHNTHFDSAGNLLQTTWQTPYLNTTTTFTYDYLDQLLTEEGPITHTYTYDSHYNRTSLDSLPYILNDLNELISHHNYDANGNPITHQECTLTYDALDRLTTVITPTSAIYYSYDPLNRRTLRNKVPFLYDDNLEIGTPNNIRILGLTPHAEISSAILYEMNNSHYIPIHDTFGNPTLILSTWGFTKESTYYSSFGEELHHTTPFTPWRYSSKRLDPETSLIHFGFRHYDPTTGRFLTPDPKGFADNIPNLYTFLLNSPLLHFDLWGTTSIPRQAHLLDFFHYTKTNPYGTIPIPGREIPGVHFNLYAGNTNTWNTALKAAQYVSGELGGVGITAYHEETVGPGDPFRTFAKKSGLTNSAINYFADHLMSRMKGNEDIHINIGHSNGGQNLLGVTRIIEKLHPEYLDRMYNYTLSTAAVNYPQSMKGRVHHYIPSSDLICLGAAGAGIIGESIGPAMPAVRATPAYWLAKAGSYAGGLVSGIGLGYYRTYKILQQRDDVTFIQTKRLNPLEVHAINSDENKIGLEKIQDLIKQNHPTYKSFWEHKNQ